MIFDLDFNIQEDQQYVCVISSQIKASKIVIEKLTLIQENIRELSGNNSIIIEESRNLEDCKEALSKGIDALNLMGHAFKKNFKVPSLELTGHVKEHGHETESYIDEKILQWVQQRSKEILSDQEPVLEEDFQLYFFHLSNKTEYNDKLSDIVVFNRETVIIQKINEMQEMSIETTRMFTNFLTKLHAIFAFEVSLLEGLFPKKNVSGLILDLFKKIQVRPVLNSELSFVSVFEMNIMLQWYDLKFHKILRVSKGLSFLDCLRGHFSDLLRALLTREFKDLEKKVFDSQDLLSTEPPFWLMVKIDDMKKIKDTSVYFLENDDCDDTNLCNYGEMIQKIILALEAVAPMDIRLPLIINCLAYFRDILPSDSISNIISNRVDLLVNEKSTTLVEFSKEESSAEPIIERINKIISIIVNPRIKSITRDKLISSLARNLDEKIARNLREL